MTANSADTKSRSAAFKGALATILVSVVTSAITTGVQSEADIDYPDATRFIQDYYRDVTNPNLRERLYEESQTETFKSFPGNDRESFTKFYDTIEKVNVLKTYPIASESNRYFVELEFKSKKSRTPTTEQFKFYLACDSLLARLPVITCPTRAIRIDVVQKVDAA